ncbi:MAG: T9SS type A sorting domain-containing protein, partial [Bacteroidota bacterium]
SEINQLYTLSGSSVSYLWSTGETAASISATPTQTTTYYVTVSNGISTCTDSVTITVNPPDTTVIKTVECEPITWNGQLYSQSGVYTYVTSNAAGCDSVVVLDLTISPLTLTGSSTACSAYDSYDGTATAGASGGNAPYTYTWNTLPVQNTATAAGLHAGDYTVTVMDAKGCVTTLTITVTQPAYVCEPFRTYAKGGWGAVNSGFNPGTYLINNFATSYPNGLQIGACNRFIKLNSAAAVTAFLPTSGTPARLPNGTLVDPTATSYKNTLAGHLVALNLNITIDSLNPSFAASTVMFKNAIIALGPYAGYTVQQLYNEANQAIGCSNNKTYLTRLNTALDSTNASWRNGLRRNNYVVCPGTALARTSAFEEPAEPTESDKITAYPNPSSGLLNLRAGGDTPIRIELYNLLGECLMNTGWKTELDLHSLPNGLYLLRARYADGSSGHQRIELIK